MVVTLALMLQAVLPAVLPTVLVEDMFLGASLDAS